MDAAGISTWEALGNKHTSTYRSMPSMRNFPLMVVLVMIVAMTLFFTLAMGMIGFHVFFYSMDLLVIYGDIESF